MKQRTPVISLHPELVGNSYRFESDKGTISLIHPCYATMNQYEIYCIKGNLFDDVERFSSLEEATKVIEKYLGEEENEAI